MGSQINGLHSFAPNRLLEAKLVKKRMLLNYKLSLTNEKPMGSSRQEAESLVAVDKIYGSHLA